MRYISSYQNRKHTIMQGKKIVFVSKGVAELQDYQVQGEQPARNHVFLKTICTLISPGTERANLLDQVDGNKGFPKCLGYSAIATVLAVGEDVKGFAVGDRVAVYHSHHTSYQYKHVEDLVKVEDDNLPSEDAVFCIVAAMGFQGLRKMRMELGESVMVMGLGLLGMFALQCARLSGAYPLIAVDFAENRRRIACELGADIAFSPDAPNLAESIVSLTRGGADGVVEATGNPEALNLGLPCMASQGRIALVGCSRTPTHEIDFYNRVHRPGISIIGAHNFVRPKHDSYPGYWTMREDMAMLMRFFAAGRLQTRPLLSSIEDPKDCPGIYREIAAGNRDIMGIVFDWSQY